jgi:hypothetical protein
MTDQPKEWWQQGYGFKVQAGTKINGKEVGYGVITDEHTGYAYYKNGDKWDLSLKTSLEVCGKKVNEKEPAKIIYAKNGDIHFEAVNGQITLKARSIRLVAEIDGPTSRIKGTNIDIPAQNSVNIMGQYVETAAGVQESSSSLVDIFQGSFIGQILNSLGNLKKFLQLL